MLGKICLSCLEITLKLMVGDNVTILRKAFWRDRKPNNSYTTVASDLFTALANTRAVAGTGKGATGAV